jgi:hypothetical protein
MPGRSLSQPAAVARDHGFMVFPFGAPTAMRSTRLPFSLDEGPLFCYHMVG